ncbi:hypothetical protein BRD00_01925 [Halobacteriales archaeon QS_8_69_26]|nr:MAG: hypothetical protein BRD00_01925 [Halobacteriales archaeon QS_8_69_26]
MDDSTRASDESRTGHDRRRFLGLLAAVGTASVAGCTASGSGDDTTPTPDPTSTRDPTTGQPPDGNRYPDYGDDVARVVGYEDVDPPTDAVYVEPGSEGVTLPSGEISFTMHNGTHRTFATNFYGWRIDRWEDGWHHVAPRFVNQPLMHLRPGGSHTWRITVDNTDLRDAEKVSGNVGGTTDVTVPALGGGTYAFAADGWFEGDGSTTSSVPEHERQTAVAARFTVEGPALELSLSDWVTDTARDGDTVTVTPGDRPERESSRPATYVLRRDPDVEDPRTLVTEQVIREWPLRDALAALEPGVETVRVETTTGAYPAFGIHEPVAVEYEGETFGVETEDPEN